jgi:hypothetical protein
MSLNLQNEVLKRGRAYRCLGCIDGRAYEGEKRHVISHFFKYHVPLDFVPYYCSLCHFQTEDEMKLREHIKSYGKHKEAVKELVQKGEKVNDTEYLHKNQHPVSPLEGVNFERLGKEESAKVWGERVKKSEKSESTLLDPTSSLQLPLLFQSWRLTSMIVSC